MNIRFTVNNTNYRMSSDNYQIILEEVRETKEGVNKGKETFTNRVNLRTPIQALSYIAENQICNCEAETFTKLAIYHTETLDRLNAIADEYSLKG